MMSKKLNKSYEKFKTMIGGQALIEGILMRGPKKQAIVVRGPDGMVEKVEELKLISDRHKIFGAPLIRGVVNFGSSMVNGVRALIYSASFFPEDEEEEPSKLDKWIEGKFGSEKLEKFVIYSSVVLGTLFSVFLFIMLPGLVADLFSGIVQGHFVRNLLEGLIRIVIFLGYLIGVSRLKDMKRVFSYHGAEHKTIRCYESGEPLTVENVREKSRFHPRCGTSFLFVVVILSILIFTVIRADHVLLRLGLRLLLLPVVVSLGYELNRFVGRHPNKFTSVLTAPGLWLQNFTTNEPDDSMIEVAIRSLELVLPEKAGEDRW